ncbi:acyltransferase [Cloacibacterium rupense]|uniref:Acyltransferase n=1 Tax=Cloacibacterium rupense TaxID=517423 RepID=A0ABQ2NJT9_9FLAO|nr:acyltransferase [Cloacibacterium rupense]GGP03106.1 acyltransferase [Cloacibacterium rupense]
MTINTKAFFPSLTGYRAVAAWLIFLYHFFPFKSPKIPDLVKNIAEEFHIGVDMFFVLSGFLITYRYYGAKPINFRKYIVNRVARIYPMYFVVTLLVFSNFYLVNQYWDSETTKQFLLSITMTKALFKDYFLVGIPQGWTLTLEELFYLAAPLYFLLIKRNQKFLFYIPIVIFIFGLMLKTFAGGKFWGFMQINIANYIFQFFVGIALALTIKKRYFAKLEFKYFTFLGVTALLFYLFTRSYVAQFINFKNDFIRALELFTVALFGIAPLLYGLIHEKTFIQNILSSKTMVLLGKSSYIFYLIHKGFISILFNDFISENKLFLFIFLNVLSIMMFQYLEEPINNYIRRKFASKND